MTDLIIFATPALLLLIGAVIIRARRLSRGDLGIRGFRPAQLAVWGLAFLALAVAQEWFSARIGLASEAGAWVGKYDSARLAIRIFAVALLYPVVEEFFFRGVMLGLLRRFGALIGIVGSSALFALAHVQYDWRGMAMVLADALFYAVCRVRTGSTALPMIFHVAGNGFAVWQRLHL